MKLFIASMSIIYFISSVGAGLVADEPVPFVVTRVALASYAFLGICAVGIINAVEKIGKTK